MQRSIILLLNLFVIITCHFHGHSFKDHGTKHWEYQRYPPVLSLITNGILSVHSRPFYVRLIYTPQSEFFCGGAIIDRLWVITAAHCLEPFERSHRVPNWKNGNILTSDIAVEVGDFTLYMSSSFNRKRRHRVATWYFVPGYQYSLKPINNVAILRLTDPVEDRWRRIPLCRRTFDLGTKIATCGMGSKNGSVPIFPLKLQEAHFLETKYTTVSCRGFPVRYVPPREPVVPCPDDVICTRSVLSNSNICHKDEGSPLYVVNMCSDSQLSAFGGPGSAECLYGVASYFQSKSSSTCNGTSSTQHTEVSPNDPQLEDDCNDGSFFARVNTHAKWIDRMIKLHS
ncbi:factor V activator RVV-V alpha-like isoform X2 [Convolutriloba macropyga]|uniref:factor V activator RVV-V alpha-like isoform X2 n=1 Tax=Convolutriloba macropyga TaxID=536237 RepID=UPI003F51DDE3